MMESDREVLCRKKQFHLLEGLIREAPCRLPNSVFIHGLGGTGKTLLVQSLLKSRKIRYAIGNCFECYSVRIIYESLLNQLAGVLPSKETNYASYASCESFNDFVSHFKSITHSSKDRWAFIFEHSEHLRDCDANVFPALCRLQEFCDGINVCVIFTSHFPLFKYTTPMEFIQPFVVHFPQYSKDELIKIIVAEKPDCILSDDGFKNYVNLLLSVFYMATRNLPELKSLALLNLPFYVAPLERGDVKESDLALLWRNIEPRLTKALATVYLREVSSEQFIHIQSLIDAGETVEATKVGAVTKMELPFYSKFLLIASYLASFNPTKSDKRFFTKHHGKQKKTLATIKAKQRSSSHMVGPKPFPLDRLMAIFYAIIEDKVAPTASIFSQISTLVSLGLVVPIGGDILDAPKFKSNVTLERIRFIARTVNFNIVDYLYDFSH